MNKNMPLKKTGDQFRDVKRAKLFPSPDIIAHGDCFIAKRATSLSLSSLFTFIRQACTFIPVPQSKGNAN